MIKTSPAMFLLFSLWYFSFVSWRHGFWYWPGFLQWWQAGLCFSGFGFVACCVTVFVFSSSGAFKPFSSNSFSMCVTLCSLVLFSKWAWFMVFYMCGGILADMNCSLIAWAATPKAFFASFWSSSRKSYEFWFAGLKSSCWTLYSSVALDWGFTHFLRNTFQISPTLSPFWLLVFLNVWERENSSFCLLLWADCIFWDLFKTDIQTFDFFLISNRK